MTPPAPQGRRRLGPPPRQGANRQVRPSAKRNGRSERPVFGSSSEDVCLPDAPGRKGSQDPSLVRRIKIRPTACVTSSQCQTPVKTCPSKPHEFQTSNNSPDKIADPGRAGKSRPANAAANSQGPRCSPIAASDAQSWVQPDGIAAPPKPKAGGARRDRTDDLMLAKHALSQLSYGPILGFAKKGSFLASGAGADVRAAVPRIARAAARKPGRLSIDPQPQAMVGLGRLERPTSPLSGVRSNHLSYRPVRPPTESVAPSPPGEATGSPPSGGVP